MNRHFEQMLRHVKDIVTTWQYFIIPCFSIHVGLKCKGEKCFVKL